MWITAFRGEYLDTESCRLAAERAVELLGDVAEVRRLTSLPALATPEPPFGGIPKKMWRAALLIGDEDLTPMAAVAGAIAEGTADYLVSRGMTKVMVANGGDIALAVGPDEALTVGIRPDVERATVSHTISVSLETGIRGIATSGVGGRSLTRGVASAAVVFASGAAMADAAATAVANAVTVSSLSVERCNAEELSPDTDLTGLDVVKSVGRLTADETEDALARGLAKADVLVSRELIKGACIFVQGSMACTEGIRPLLKLYSEQTFTNFHKGDNR
jgi:hypothetical protein